jgi:hypothetical protein
VIEQLTRERAWLIAVRRLDHGDAARGLHDAVETSASRPRAGMTPGVEVHHDHAGVALGQILLGETEPVEGTGAIPTHHDVSPVEQMPQGRRTTGGADIHHRAALSQQGVGRVTSGHVRPMPRVDAEHVGAERTEIPGGHRTSDDPRQIEHPYPGER